MANGAFNKGTGTLASNDLINAFLELALLCQTQERIALGEENTNGTLTANGLTVPDFINITADYNADTMTVAIPALPIETSLVSGNLTIEATDYLAPINAVFGAVDNSLDVTGADLSKTNKIQALLELAQLIQTDEQADPEGDNNMTLTIDTDGGTASLNATFPGTPQVNANGRIEFVATNYLA